MADLKPAMQLVFTEINKCLAEGDAELKKEDVSVLSGAGATNGGGAAVRIIIEVEGEAAARKTWPGAVRYPAVAGRDPGWRLPPRGRRG